MWLVSVWMCDLQNVLSFGLRGSLIPLLLFAMSSLYIFYRETERVTQTIVKDTGEVVKTTGVVTDVVSNDLDRILHFANFGTDRVPMTPEDVALIKKGSNSGTETPSLILMGFKPLDSLSMAQTVLDDKTYFIYPNNDDVDDDGTSTVAFANLHAAMLRKGVVGIGELLTRVTATSRMVAILAQQQQVVDYQEEGGVQVLPPGMLVVSLPFEDDVRAMAPDKNPMEANDELVQAAMDLMQHQTLEGVEIGTNFDNAAIDRFWTYLEAVALETTIPPKQDYETELNEEAVLQVAGAQIAAFRDLLPVDVKQEGKQPRKRKATLAADESGIDWVEVYKTNALFDCTIDHLKSYLRSIGARLGGKKNDLTFRVSQSIAERIQAGTI